MLLKILKYSIIIVLAILAINIFSYYQDINSPADQAGTEKKFIVVSGESVKAIARNLQAEGLIKSAPHFEFYVWRAKMGAMMQAGTYALSPRLTIKDIAASLTAGKVVNLEKEITIIPGWTLRDIAKYLEAQGIASSSDFYKLAGEPLKDYSKLKNAPADYSADYQFLADKPKNYGLEGYLFPDTYRIFPNADARDVIIKMLVNLDGKLTSEMRAEIKKQGKTIYEVITLASVIEKEVSKMEDMKIVSGIFQNRMKAGQALESCATLAYILGKNKPIYTIDDTQTVSPYNTYRHQGLPPGPICNPSLAAITAAIYPAETAYNYFLSRPDTGGTVFSKTLDEHNRNKAKYLK
jgi:UPF0755 protein